MMSSRSVIPPESPPTKENSYLFNLLCKKLEEAERQNKILQEQLLQNAKISQSRKRLQFSDVPDGKHSCVSRSLSPVQINMEDLVCNSNTEGSAHNDKDPLIFTKDKGNEIDEDDGNATNPRTNPKTNNSNRTIENRGSQSKDLPGTSGENTISNLDADLESSNEISEMSNKCRNLKQTLKRKTAPKPIPKFLQKSNTNHEVDASSDSTDSEYVCRRRSRHFSRFGDRNHKTGSVHRPKRRRRINPKDLCGDDSSEPNEDVEMVTTLRPYSTYTKRNSDGTKELELALRKRHGRPY